MEEQTLLSILQKRYDIAKKFTKENYIKQAKRAVYDYNAKDEYSQLEENTQYNRHNIDVNSRYEMVIPVVFNNTEAMKASLFERLPDLVLKGRGEDDSQKQKIVNAAYEYLKDKLNLYDVAMQAGHWYVLTGFTSVYNYFESRGKEVPIMDEMGQPIIGEDGEPIMEVKYIQNDPMVEVLDYEKVYFAPDSQFDYRAENVPYYYVDKLMTPEEVQLTYGVEVDPDTSLETYGEDDSESKNKDREDDKDRVLVHFYCGELPFSNSEELEEYNIDYNPDSTYLLIYTSDKILHAAEKEDMRLNLAKFYGQPNEFFGFGFGKIGRTFQIEKSIRRGQQMRLADVAAYPKWAIPQDVEVSDKDLLDPRANVVLRYRGDKAPSILQPGNLAEVVNIASQEAEKDSQQAFGLLDLATGSQQSTVDTATGQTIFAEAAQRRVAFYKKKFMFFYREMVISLLKLCQQYWDEDKIISIMGEDGQEEQVVLNRESLKDVDFDRDVDIDMETTSVNRDVIRQQWIALYDRTKGDPLVDRQKIVIEMMQNSFGIKNAKQFVNDVQFQPGQVLIDPQTGEQFQADQSGQLISAQQMQNQPAASGGNGAQAPLPGTQADVNQTVPGGSELDGLGV